MRNDEERGRNSFKLALLNLLKVNNVDVRVITDTEIPSSGQGDYNVKGYHSYLPLSPSKLLKTAKYRAVVLVRSLLAIVAKIRLDLMHLAVQSIWIQLDLGAKMSAYSSQQQNRQGRPNPVYSSQQQPPTKGRVTRFLVCGMYREWSDLIRESMALSRVRDQLQAAAAEVDNVIFAGDINLDTARRSDMRYVRRCLMLVHDNAVADSNMRYLETGVTYHSNGQHLREDGEVRGHESVLDHICLTRDMEATLRVLPDPTRDHSPVVASVLVNRVAPTTKSINRKNFKALERPALLRTLDSWPWSDV
jgi:hypothetical protein